MTWVSTAFTKSVTGKCQRNVPKASRLARTCLGWMFTLGCLFSFDYRRQQMPALPASPSRQAAILFRLVPHQKRNGKNDDQGTQAHNNHGLSPWTYIVSRVTTGISSPPRAAPLDIIPMARPNLSGTNWIPQPSSPDDWNYSPTAMTMKAP